ncbi:SDR family oxidoreductase [Candidatus Margulisiibacteriota bacterium]
MNNDILVLGGSSDIGKALIPRIKSTLPDHKIIITKHSEKDDLFQDSNIKEFTIDFSDKGSTDKFIEKIKGFNIGYCIQLQGNAKPKDTIESTSPENIQFNLQINLLSTISIIKKILPIMKKADFGRIVLVSTASANFGGGFESFGYGLAKYGVGYLIKYLAKYYTKHNILSNCVSPGFIDTKFHERTLGRSKKVLKERGKMVRLGRPGTPDDVAKEIYNLAFINNFISGENIKIDGADFI